VAALGIDSEGFKHPLGLMEGATEHSAVVQALIDDLIERGEELPMTTVPRLSILTSTMLVSPGLIVPSEAQQTPNMTFFVTSVGPGKGGDLGGLSSGAFCARIRHRPSSNGA
jgi:hypothetical protein